VADSRRFPEEGEYQTLPEPWIEVDYDRSVRFGEELVSEVAAGHSLFGQPLRVIAQCRRCDSILGALDDGRWFVSHLTWTTSKPDRPPWPSTTIEGTLDELLAEFADHCH
jgi:hypothetical protein